MLFKKTGLLAALLMTFTACSSLSQVDADGSTHNPVFPDPESVTLHTGTWPNIENLRQVKSGLTRDQLYDLIGRPHFAEGFRVNEWDYLFHFTTPEGQRTCQFKVLFDRDRIARSTYWAPEACAAIVDLAAPEQSATQQLSIAADVGFAFDSAVLTVAGTEVIQDIVRQLPIDALQSIRVAGYTDRLGAASYNQNLSQQRANAVRNALVAQGVPAYKVQAQGYGAERPLVQCDQESRSSLISCLAPNRRVDLHIDANIPQH